MGVKAPFGQSMSREWSSTWTFINIDTFKSLRTLLFWTLVDELYNFYVIWTPIQHFQINFCMSPRGIKGEVFTLFLWYRSNQRCEN
jgi:hypothetical protein